jgi:hypothetical protein
LIRFISARALPCLQVTKIALMGSAGDTFNVAEIKKVEEGG